MRYRLLSIYSNYGFFEIPPTTNFALGDLFEIGSRRYPAILHSFEEGRGRLIFIEPIGEYLTLRDTCVHLGNDQITFTPNIINNGPIDGLLRNLGDYTQGVSVPYGLSLSNRYRNSPRAYTFIPTVPNRTTLSSGQPYGYVEVGSLRIYSFLPEATRDYEIIFSDSLEGISDQNVVATWGPNNLQLRTTLLFDESPTGYRRVEVTRERISTGLRAPDLLYPVFEGSSLAVAGGFGTGKSSLMVYLMNHLPFDVVIYSACGERGNEITGLLEDLEETVINTIIMANTSDMSALLRARALFSSARIAAHLSRMGLKVLLIADSTSRWAEALRENVGILQQRTGDSGYPADIFSQLGRYYGYAGVFESPVGSGSVTLFSIISPPGGDMSDPVVQNTLQFVRTVWFLSPRLRERRHFPAIDWRTSYINDRSTYVDSLSERSPRSLELLQSVEAHFERHKEIHQIVQIFGENMLTPRQRVEYLIPNLIINYFLRQRFGAATGFQNIEEMEALIEFIEHIYTTMCEHLSRDREGFLEEEPITRFTTAVRNFSLQEREEALGQIDQIFREHV